jgi:HD-GYP domain-containing protein (c-di-GMP phosphodiesterase class II)
MSTDELGRAMAGSVDLMGGIDAIARENEELGRELLRCYEQLSMVFEITEHIATLEDPAGVESGLLTRFATMLEADAVYIDRAVGLTSASLGLPVPDDLPPLKVLASVLLPELEETRRSQRARVRTITRADIEQDGPETGEAGEPVAFALTSTLRQLNEEPAVVIALRSAVRPCFDSSDMMAAESVLGYGGHVLSNMLMVRHLQRMAYETVRALVSAIDQKDKYTYGHAERVGWLSKFTGAALDLPDTDLTRLEWAGLLHDVGKIGVPEDILNKPGRLTDEEFEIMKQHPCMSYEVLKPVASLEPVLDGVLYHHENHDGSGYPDGLCGEDIPLIARIIHVVDIFDALTSTRSYREGFTVEKAISILEADAGRVTDPDVTRVFIDAFHTYMREQPEDYRHRFPHLQPQVQEVAE